MVTWAVGPGAAVLRAWMAATTVGDMPSAWATTGGGTLASPRSWERAADAIGELRANGANGANGKIVPRVTG